jgi:FO synthase
MPALSIPPAKRAPEALLERAAAGRGISRDAALLLAGLAPLDALLEAARRVRRAFHGRVVTFSRKVFIPLTTLCRDFCGYCAFRKDPGQPGAGYMTPAEVLDAARAARRAGCKEALFSLGDQPERAFPEARAFLAAHGFSRTLDYLAAMCRLVLDETGLLPHSNPGLMSAADLARLRATNVSAGLMLENVSARLLRPGQAHWGAPDKVPALRLAVIEAAGRARFPFTTGILVGIGETMAERVDSLFAIRALHERFGHIQEVIIQNFRAKPATRMAACPDAAADDYLRTIALARLILPGAMNVQAPPNLSYADFPRLLDAGINDWGGISPVTRDFINPEAAWPQISALRAAAHAAGLELRERLAIYPEFVSRCEFVHPALRPRLAALADSRGYARPAVQIEAGRDAETVA